MRKGNKGGTPQDGAPQKTKEQIKSELKYKAKVAKNKKMIRDVFAYLSSIQCNLYDFETIVQGASGLLKEEVRRRQDVAINEMDSVEIDSITLRIRETKDTDKESKMMNKKIHGLIDVLGEHSLLQANDQLPEMVKKFDEILVNKLIKEREDTPISELFDIDTIL